VSRSGGSVRRKCLRKEKREKKKKVVARLGEGKYIQQRWEGEKKELGGGGGRGWGGVSRVISEKGQKRKCRKKTKREGVEGTKDESG